MTITDSIWADGGLDIKRVAAFLSCSHQTARVVIAEQKWERRYLGAKVLYPLAAVRAYLDGLPSEPTQALKNRAVRLQARSRKAA